MYKKHNYVHNISIISMYKKYNYVQNLCSPSTYIVTEVPIYNVKKTYNICLLEKPNIELFF